jgi:hypothetical protein
MFIAEKYVKKRVINGSYVPRFILFIAEKRRKK